MDFVPGLKVVIEPGVPQVAGPFELALQLSGFDLNHTCSKDKRALLIVTTTICVLLSSFFLVAVALTLFREAKPLTVLWSDLNILLGLSVYALTAGLCLASWTKKGFLETFQRELGRLRTLRVLPNDAIDNFRIPIMKAMVFSILLVATWILTSMKEIVYHPTLPTFNMTAHQARFSVSWRNMYGALPVVYLWMGVVSAIATSVYWLAHEHLRREMTYFNEELVKASRSQQLTLPDVFAAYGRRHLDLMALLQHVNAHLGKLAMVCGLCAIISMACSTYTLMSFNRLLSLPYLVLLSLWNPISVGMIMIIIGEPGKVQETILSSYRMFMDRSKGSSRMFLINAIPIGRLTYHMAIFIAPTIAVLLAFLSRLIGIVHM